MTDHLKHTDLSKRLRQMAVAAFTEPHRVIDKLMSDAADEIDRYYTGMLNWKASAEEKDAKIIDLRARIAELEAAALAAQPVKVEPTDEHAAFEVAMRPIYDLTRCTDGDYAGTAAHAAWVAWQARAALAAIQPTAAPPVTPKHIEEIKDLLLWPVTEDDARTARDMLQSLHFDLSMAASDAATIQPAAQQGLLSSGAKMANTMYNLAQQFGGTLTARDCERFSDLYKEWDEARSTATTVPATPQEWQGPWELQIDSYMTNRKGVLSFLSGDGIRIEYTDGGDRWMLSLPAPTKRGKSVSFTRPTAPDAAADAARWRETLKHIGIYAGWWQVQIRAGDHVGAPPEEFQARFAEAIDAALAASPADVRAMGEQEP